jgi:prepilin-type N-terminal cleavage/methylation domain-containing protein
MNLKHSKERAFTLIELLVVIAIVGILSSVIYTNITGLRDRAKVTAGIRFDSSLLHSIGDQLVGEWTFDSPSLPLIDTSGFGNNGTCTSCPTYATTSGYNNKGAESFDGTDNYINISGGSSLKMTDEVTVSAWVNLQGDVVASHETAVVLGAPASRLTFVVKRNFTLFRFSYWDINNSWKESTLTLTRGQFYHLVWVVKNGQYVKFYSNGQFVGSSTLSAFPTLDGSAKIGFSGGSAEFLRGTIDDVRIYSSALSGSDIQKLYAKGKTSHEVATK